VLDLVNLPVTSLSARKGFDMEHFQISPTLSDASAPAEVNNHASYVRLLGQEDENELCRIFLTLEPSARYCRFGLAASDARLAFG
jgi:hypothetical protein